MNPEPLQYLPYLARQRFTVVHLADAALVPQQRIQDWLKRDGFRPLIDQNPGRGKAREFVLADAYRVALMATLTDEDESPFALPIHRAARIVDSAFGLIAEDYPENEHHVANARAEYLGGAIPREFMERTPARLSNGERLPYYADPTMLVGGINHRIEPDDKILQGRFCHADRVPDIIPNPRALPVQRLVLEATPIVARVDRRLLAAFGVTDLFDELKGDDTNG